MLEKTTDFRLGESKIMVARSKAGIASKATMQIRNKVIKGYKESMRTPV
jgi:flagellar hook-basal body complex protein FliE|tara:strand:+ start:5763 stop:5909 length:147 start_codon:yes stop_codon:yes gene_type:complete